MPGHTILPPWDDFRRFWDDCATSFGRAAQDLKIGIDRFIADFASEYKFSATLEVSTRVKSAERAYQKVQRYHSKGELLGPDVFYGVGDVVGARLICRGLGDQECIKRALSDGNLGFDLVVDDTKITQPTVTGYRALHVNARIPARVLGRDKKIPAEIQVKTLAQDIWGTFTHADAYSRADLRNDPRFELVQNLNRLLSGHLHVVDELSREIDKITANVANDIANNPIDFDADLTYKEILAILYQEYGEVIHNSTAEGISLTARGSGLATGQQFKSAVVPIVPRAIEELQRFRTPRLDETIAKALEIYNAEAGGRNTVAL